MKALCVGNGQLDQMYMLPIVGTLDCMHDQKITLIYDDSPVVINSSGGGYPQPLQRAMRKEQEQEMETNENMSSLSGRKYCLRRLTPTECLRLQGLPDWWCNGAGGSDSAIYKMAGNGIAIPCACDVLGRIAEEIRTHG